MFTEYQGKKMLSKFLQRYHWGRGKPSKYFQVKGGVFNFRPTSETLPKEAYLYASYWSSHVSHCWWLTCAPKYLIRKSSRTLAGRRQEDAKENLFLSQRQNRLWKGLVWEDSLK